MAFGGVMLLFCVVHFMYIPEKGLEEYLAPGAWYWYKEQWYKREFHPFKPVRRTSLLMFGPFLPLGGMQLHLATCLRELRCVVYGSIFSHSVAAAGVLSVFQFVPVLRRVSVLAVSQSRSPVRRHQISDELALTVEIPTSAPDQRPGCILPVPLLHRRRVDDLTSRIRGLLLHSDVQLDPRRNELICDL